MVPSVSRRVQWSQLQKTTHDAKWLPGEVVQKTGPLSCQVQLQDGTVRRRHQDHILKRFTEQVEEVATPLETVPQEESWELTPNQT